MRKIHISPTKKTDLQNWLIDRAAPPSWLGSVPSPCVYVLFCRNKKNENCCDRNNVLIIPANGYRWHQLWVVKAEINKRKTPPRRCFADGKTCWSA